MRWRMRGAWQWPTFFAVTLIDGAVLSALPFYADGPGGFVPGVLLAGFANLIAVAVLAPLGGRLVRRRRPDLPKLVASNYAGTALVSAILVLLVAGGIAHRPAATAAEQERLAVIGSMHTFVLNQQPALRSQLAATDVLRGRARALPRLRPAPAAAPLAVPVRVHGPVRRPASRATPTRRPTTPTASTAASGSPRADELLDGCPMRGSAFSGNIGFRCSGGVSCRPWAPARRWWPRPSSR